MRSQHLASLRLQHIASQLQLHVLKQESLIPVHKFSLSLFVELDGLLLESHLGGVLVDCLESLVDLLDELGNVAWILQQDLLLYCRGQVFFILRLSFEGLDLSLKFTDFDQGQFQVGLQLHLLVFELELVYPKDSDSLLKFSNRLPLHSLLQADELASICCYLSTCSFL